MNKKTVKDPFQEREAAKYDNPIPSREYIMEFLAKENRPLGHAELCEVFHLTGEDEIEALRRRLIAMSRDHQLQSSGVGEYSLLMDEDLIEGVVQGNKEGHGFLLRAADDDIFLSARQMMQVMDGDRVKVRLSGRSVKGRLDGIIVEVVERKHEKLVGRFYRESQVSFVTPENPRIAQDIIITTDSGLAPTHGQYVVVEITRFPEKGQPAEGMVSRILGDFMAPGLEIDVALHRFEIPYEWPPAVVQQVTQYGVEVSEEDKLHRVDLRNAPFVTIDGEDARDFDDAVYCERTTAGWKLYVAIADVSHYVRKGSSLDEEAIRRGNSVYFPGRVIPMLPEVLSNGLCSLNPNVDRLAMVAEVSLTTRGKMRSFRFYEAVIRSHARLTYTKVAKMIAAEPDDQGIELRSRYAALTPHIDHLYQLYQVLRGAREERGAIEFDTVETRMVFDQNAKIDQIVPIERNDAHKLIEECMLCANVATAELMLKANLPALFRIHEGPKEEKLLALRTYLSALGLSLGGGLKPTPLDYAELAEQIKDRADAHSIQTMILRSMSQAVYHPDNVGHFGLHYEAYTHFTSPIRRYPDLLVHRAIRYLIRGEGSPRLRQVQRVAGSATLKAQKIYGYDHAEMDRLGESCSMTERRADEAVRDVEAWLKCQYVEQHVGDVFDGHITAVTPFGVFVELAELYVEGLVHISALGNDYFVHDPDHQAIIGERSGQVFRLGDALQVTVSRVNLEQRKIDFDLVKSAGGRRKARVQKEDDDLEMILAQLPPLEMQTSLPPMELGGRGKSKDSKSAEGKKGKAEKKDSGKKDKKRKTASKGKKVRMKKTIKANGKSKAAPAKVKAKKKPRKSNAKAKAE